MKKYYIFERHNPQLPDPYYTMKDRMFKKDVEKAIGTTLYGSQVPLSYETKDAYLKAALDFKEKGFTVYGETL